MKETEVQAFLPLLLALGFVAPVAFFAAQPSTHATTKAVDAVKPRRSRKTTTAQSSKTSKAAKTSASAAPTPADATEPKTDPNTNPYPFNPEAIRTADELFLALDEPDVAELTLANDVFVEQNVEIDHDLTINLGGFHLISFQESARVIDVKSGVVRLTGTGQVHALGLNSATVRIKGGTSSQSNYATLTIDKGIKLYAPLGQAIYVAPNFDAAYGVTVNFAGSLTARDGIFLHGNIKGRGENLPAINILDGATLDVDEELGAAVLADGYGVWQIGAAAFTGATGIKIQAGDLHLTDTVILALGKAPDDAAWSSDLYGAGNAIEIESVENRSGNIKIKIHGGQYHSADGHVIAEHGAENIAALDKLEIMNGEFIGKLGVFAGLISEAANGAVQVKGGTFSAEISRYLAQDYYLYLEKDELGRYVVQGNAAIEEDIDEEQQRLNVAIAKLVNLVALAEHFASPEYHAGNFGSLQKTIDKIVKKLHKSLKKPCDLLADQANTSFAEVASCIDTLEQVTAEMQEVENILRAELATMADEAAFNQKRYTRESYADLADAITRSEELLGRDELNLSEIDSMLGEIDAAKMLLEEREDTEDDSAIEAELPVVPLEELMAETTSEPTERTLEQAMQELRDLLSEIDALSVLDYTPGSLAILLELAMSAEQILHDEVDGLTVEDLDEVLEHLKAAQSALELAEDDFIDDEAEIVELMDADALLAAEDASVDEDPALDDENLVVAAATDDLEADATEDILESSELEDQSSELLDAFADAETVRTLDPVEPITPTETPLESISSAATETTLEQAKTALRTLLNEASALNPADYTADSYAVFAEAISEAGRLLSNNSSSVTAEIISSLAEVVQSTKHSLIVIDSPADEARTNLIAMLEAVQDLSVNDYFEDTAEQFGELQVAITKAHSILAQPSADLFTVVGIMDEIKLATSGLKGGEATLQASLGKLRSTIAEAEQINGATYTAESFANFAKLLRQAQKLLVQPDLRFAEVDDMTAQLADAQAALVVKPADWSKLQTQLTKIASLDGAAYTEISYGYVLQLLTQAKTLLADTATPQSTVDALTANLAYAVEHLEPRPVYAATTVNQNAQQYGAAPAGYYTPQPADSSATPIPPNFLMSVMAGAYAGLATYRRSRIEAKNRKQRGRNLSESVR